MTKTYFAAVLSFLGVFFNPCAAQTSPTGGETVRRSPESRLESSEKSRNNSAAPVTFQRRGQLSFRKRISREQKKRLAPDAADWQRHETFLRQPKTGLIKLFPDVGCEENAAIVRADELCLSQIPMSGFYSFREKEHTSDYLSDIRLKDGILITDGLLTQGILVALGDVALENISLSSGGMKFLNEFTPETQGVKALDQTKQIIRGIRAGEHTYRKALPARENMTYALRAIAYRGRFIQVLHGFPYDMLAGDDRVDITVAFRVLKKDAAGNYTLLWKELDRKDAPKIIFPKRNKS